MRLHRLLLSLFRSGEDFRRWIALGSHGCELVAELPDNASSPAATLLNGIDVLCRRGHLHAGFFARLARDFPLRTRDILPVAVLWGMANMTKMRPSGKRPPGQCQAGLLAASMAAAIAFFAGTFVGDIGRELPAVHASAGETVMELAEPTTAMAAGSPPSEHMSHEVRIAARGPLKPVGPKPPWPKAAEPARPGCELPREVIAILGERADEILENPALNEPFTVIFEAHTDKPRVSPRPLPGQASRRQFYELLTGLGPAAFGGCRGVPIDVVFARHATTVATRSP